MTPARYASKQSSCQASAKQSLRKLANISNRSKIPSTKIHNFYFTYFHIKHISTIELETYCGCCCSSISYVTYKANNNIPVILLLLLISFSLALCLPSSQFDNRHYRNDSVQSNPVGERKRLAKMPETDTPHLQSLLRDLWHWRTLDSPEYATMVGLNDNTAGRLDVFTSEHINERKTQCEEFLTRASELNPDALGFEDKLNLKIVKHFLSTYIDSLIYIKYFTPLARLEGPHVTFPRLVREQMTLNSYDDFQKLLSRYGGLPRHVEQLIELTRSSIAASPHELVFEGLADYLTTFKVSVSESDFFKPFVDLPQAITEVQRRALRQQAQERIAQDILPAFESLQQFVQNFYVPSASSESGGSDNAEFRDLYQAQLIYHTATQLSPDHIHALGLTELRRIEPFMRQTIADAGLPADTNSSLSEIMASVRSSTSRNFNSVEEIVEAFTAALQATVSFPLDGIFEVATPNLLRVELSTALTAQRVLFKVGSLDGARAPVLTVDSSDIDLITRDEVTSLAVSSGIFGLHMLSEYLRSTPGLPTFRRMLGDVRLRDAPAKFPVYSSFVDGWALYAQFLAEELDIFKEPLQKLGRRSQESLHAALMVVDTGLHHLRWSQEKATQFLLDHTPLTEQAIRV